MPTPRRTPGTQARRRRPLRMIVGHGVEQSPRVFLLRRIAALLALVAAVVLVWFLTMLFQPFGAPATGE